MNTKRTTPPRHLRPLMRNLGPGWRWETRPGGHGRITSPDGRYVTASITPKNADHAARRVARDITVRLSHPVAA